MFMYTLVKLFGFFLEGEGIADIETNKKNVSCVFF